MANIVTGNFVPSFHAAQGVLKFDTAAVTFSEGAALDTFYASTATVVALVAVKNITITAPKGETEVVQLLGTEAVAVGAGIPAGGTFQNTVMDEKSFGEATLTCTMLITGDNSSLPNFLALATGTGIDITTHYRHTFGSSDSGETRNTVGSVMLNLDNGTQEVNVVMNEPFFNVGDLKPTGTDGHWEIDFEAKCLPKDFVMEEKD